MLLWVMTLCPLKVVALKENKLGRKDCKFTLVSQNIFLNYFSHLFCTLSFRWISLATLTSGFWVTPMKRVFSFAHGELLSFGWLLTVHSKLLKYFSVLYPSKLPSFQKYLLQVPIFITNACWIWFVWSF